MIINILNVPFLCKEPATTITAINFNKYCMKKSAEFHYFYHNINVEDTSVLDVTIAVRHRDSDWHSST